MSEVKVNKISPRTNCGTTQLGDAGDTITVTGDLKSNSLKTASGSTLTLGQSGDTVTLASGASQSGFGRTGTVNWDTTAKTASFTAVSGNGYFINTSSSAITMTLPASPSAGDIVSVKDYAYTFATNNLTVARNGSPIGGGSDFDLTYNTDGAFLTFIYVDGTKGWLLTDESNNTSDAVETYITATGGCITTCGDYKIHTFTGPGTFSVTGGAGPIAVADYLVIAGGGGTRNSVGASRTSGGGGAGGYRESNPAPGTDWTGSPIASPGGALPFSPGCYPVTVGAGGAPSPSAADGSNSVFSTITSNGGGGSGTGGSGAGSTHGGTVGPAGNTPPTTPAQGNPGGRGYDSGNGSANFGAGGGGGAGGAGAAASTSPSGSAGSGGNGTTSCISGSPVTRGGGGGGGAQYGPVTPSYTAGSGGPGGGGGAQRAPTSGGYSGTAGSGTANTGGGGGGNGGSPSPDTGTGGAGGSGIVIVRYRFQ
jgi:hypothetical protein